MRRLGAVVLLLAAAQPAAAQSLGGSLTVYNVQHRVLFQSAVSEGSGMFLGAQGWAGVGPLRVVLSSQMGSLGASTDSANGSTKVRVTSVAALLRLARWAEIGGQIEARRFDADAGVSVWRLMGATARFTPPMGAGLAGLIEASMFPSASVTNGPKISPALSGTVAVTYGVPGKPLEARIGYRFERFDFSGGTGADRFEQFRGIVAGIGLRLGRR